jgi:predicted MFS family arabinose efflux permease
VYLLFLALFSLSFLGFAMISVFGLLVLIRLYMGIAYSVCGSATMTLAGDVLPKKKVGPGINRFALTNSLGMAVGPFIGIQVQNIMSSKASFITLFVLTLVALFCVSCCKIKYPKVKRKKFKISDAFYKPAFPFMLNMIFLMIPFGAVIAYSSILAQEKGLSSVTPYFYVCLVAGILLSKFSTQKMIDAGKHTIFVIISLLVLIVTMISYYFMETAIHFLLAGFLFGLGYGILQPLFQSFVTGTAPALKRGAANATYLLSYDIGIGIGSLIMGVFQENIGITAGMAVTAASYVVGGLIYILYVDNYYSKLALHLKEENLL